MDIAQAYVQILPTTDGIKENLTTALNGAGESAGKSAGSKIGSALGTGMKVGAAALGVLTTGTAAVSAGMVKAAGDVAAYGDEIDKASQKLGISAVAYQEWDAVLAHSGTSMSAMKPAMKTLFSEAQKGSDAFEKLGISQAAAASMSKEDLFAATITGLQNITDENERAALATELLGKSAMEMGALLNTSAEDTQAMRDKVHELGGVMSDEVVKASAKFQDNLQDLGTAFSGIKRGIASEFLPGLNDIMDGFTRVLTGQDDAYEMFLSGTGGLIRGMENAVGTLKNIFAEIVPALIQAISEHLPRLVESAMDIVMTLGQAFMDNLPVILHAGMEAVLTLAKGIGDSLPELIPSVIDTVLTIVDGLLDNIDMLVDAGIQLVIGLAEGLINAIPKIVEKIPVIITKIIQALTQNAPKIVQAGVDLFVSLIRNLPAIIAGIVRAIPQIISSLVSGFMSYVGDMANVGLNLIKGIGKGITDGVGWVIDKVKNVAGMVVDAALSFFGIHSPSKVMMEIGGYLDQGLAQGIDKNAFLAKNAMEDLNSAVAGAVENVGMSVGITPAYGAGQGTIVEVPRQTQAAQTTAYLVLDRDVLGRVVYNLNQSETQRIGVQLAGGIA